jgi:hypothetical protein
MAVSISNGISPGEYWMFATGNFQLEYADEAVLLPMLSRAISVSASASKKVELDIDRPD